MHGYGIIAAVKELSGGEMTLKVPTLYTAIDRLTKEGLIESTFSQVFEGRTRNYFGITDIGKRALENEVERMEQAARRVRSQLRPS